MAFRGLSVHVGLLALASLLAIRSWTKEAETTPQHGETELWPGKPDQVEMVRFESNVGTITVEPRRDSHGPYFVGVVKKNPAPAPPNPQAAETKPPEPAANEPKITRFIATKEGEDLVGGIAPLRALRVLGKIPDAQKADFGFDKEDAKLFLKVAGKDHTLVFGGTTPGGTDYYAKDAATGNAYVVSGTMFRDFTNADTRLVEHKLHSFEDSDVKRVKITAGGATRELVRSTEKKDAWTKPGAPADKDETASNWMSKVDRLRSTSYAGETLSPPPAIADQVLKIEYFDDRKPIGTLELVRRPAQGPDDKGEYVAKTEHTRWYATLIRSQAEQIEQDLKSVVTP